MNKLGDYLINCLPKFIDNVTISRGKELFLNLKNHEGILPTMKFLRDHSKCQFKQLVELTAVDYSNRPNSRFEMIYCLLSHNLNSRLTVQCPVDSDLNYVPSLSDIYSSAIWSEREVFDMFGILFTNHPDLRRILTDYGFKGHPLRKDFPLTGFVEVRWDEEKKRIIEEKLELAQEFRNFDFPSPVNLKNLHFLKTKNLFIFFLF